jgi:hypothetical protein
MARNQKLGVLGQNRLVSPNNRYSLHLVVESSNLNGCQPLPHPASDQVQ